MALAAIGQICSTSSILSNLRICQRLAQDAAKIGAKALFLPEASDYIAQDADESYQLAQSSDCGKFVAGLQDAARENSIALSVGVHEPVSNGRKVRNIQLWIDKQGYVAQKYQKIHLFDVNVKDGPQIEESKGTEKGSRLVPPFTTELGKVGLLICFDVRFPEVSLSLRSSGADIITYPSAFAVRTGQTQWRPLLQARAIETQTYVIAAAQAGVHNAKRTSYGHSMIIDPWGEVVAELDGQSAPKLATAVIDLDKLRDIRRSMPLTRQNDVYPEL